MFIPCGFCLWNSRWQGRPCWKQVPSHTIVLEESSRRVEMLGERNTERWMDSWKKKMAESAPKMINDPWYLMEKWRTMEWDVHRNKVQRSIILESSIENKDSTKSSQNYVLQRLLAKNTSSQYGDIKPWINEDIFSQNEETRIVIRTVTEDAFQSLRSGTWWRSGFLQENRRVIHKQIYDSSMHSLKYGLYFRRKGAVVLMTKVRMNE